MSASEANQRTLGGRPTNRALTASAAALAAVLLAAACTRDPSPAQAYPPETLRITLPKLPHMAIVHVAAVKGYFAEEGLTVEFVAATFGGSAIQTVLTGDSDLAIAGEVPFTISVAKGEALGMVASLSNISNDDAIVARRDRGIAVPHDLAGKTIGITFRTTGSYVLRAYLTRNQLAPDSVRLVDLPPEKIVQALASGTVDAVSTWQPISSQARAELGENALSLGGPNGYRTTVLAFGRLDFLKTHAGAMQKFIRAMLKAEAFMHSRPEEALALASAWLKIDVDALRPSWAQINFRVNLLQTQLLAMEDVARWAMSRGYVATGPVPNLLPYLYLDALVAIQPDRVTVLR